MTDKFSVDKDSSKYKLQRLKEVLDIYGARSELWPEADRARLLEIISQDRRAHSLFLEAKAFDSLIQTVPDIKVPEELNLRILSSVLKTERSDNATPDVPRNNVVPLFSNRQGRLPFKATRKILPTAALMAASLLIGVYIGYSDLSTISPLGDATTEVAVLEATEQNEFSNLLMEQSMEESLSFTEDLL